MEHRPYPLPGGPWVMAQRWDDLLFAHYPVAPEILAAFVPSCLAIDTLAGQAWISVVPFRMGNSRLRLLPPIPGASGFFEVNVRTYVIHQGKPGIYSFSMDAASPAVVWAARTITGFPYFHARIRLTHSQEGILFASRRTEANGPAASFRAGYKPVSEVFNPAQGSLGHWLTERYCVYHMRAQQLYRTDIHHRQWPLQQAECRISENSLLDQFLGASAIPTPPSLVHFCQSNEVLLWPPRPVDKQNC